MPVVQLAHALHQCLQHPDAVVQHGDERLSVRLEIEDRGQPRQRRIARHVPAALPVVGGQDLDGIAHQQQAGDLRVQVTQQLPLQEVPGIPLDDQVLATGYGGADHGQQAADGLALFLGAERGVQQKLGEHRRLRQHHRA
ncbi:conserved hypothetical protein, partial [Ricinus communis]